MKTSIMISKKSAGWCLSLTFFFFSIVSCSLEELPEPYPQPPNFQDPSQGDLFPTTISEDTIIWSWGMNESTQPGIGIMNDRIQQRNPESN
jgi:hypothetical protein